MAPSAQTKEWHAQTKGNGEWEPIWAPFACSYYSISTVGNTVPFDKCSDPEDASTLVTGLTAFQVNAPRATQLCRWDQGDVITYVRSSSPLNLYFLK